MRKIFKYELSPEKNSLLTYKNAKFLAVQVQKNIPYIWVEVDSEEDMASYTYYLIPTGSDFPSDNSLNYLGTFQIYNGDLVFHVYIKDQK